MRMVHSNIGSNRPLKCGDLRIFQTWKPIAVSWIRLLIGWTSDAKADWRKNSCILNPCRIIAMDFTELTVKVTTSSTIAVKRDLYSVPHWCSKNLSCPPSANITRAIKTGLLSMPGVTISILLIGPSGVGKSYIAAALGLHLIEQGIRVKWIPATALIQHLQRAKKNWIWWSPWPDWESIVCWLSMISVMSKKLIHKHNLCLNLLHTGMKAAA